MMSQQELISVFDDAKASFNSQGDRSGYLNLYDSSVITHGFPPNLPGNFEGLKIFYNALWAAFPDSHLEFDDIVVQGDKVAARFTFSGTQKGELMGIPPTDRKVRVQGMRFFIFRGTKCIETWNLIDMLSMMQQLGGYQNLMTAVRSSTELSARLLGSGSTKRVVHSTRSPNMTAIGIAAEFVRQLSILNTK